MTEQHNIVCDWHVSVALSMAKNIEWFFKNWWRVEGKPPSEYSQRSLAKHLKKESFGPKTSSHYHLIDCSLINNVSVKKRHIFPNIDDEKSTPT